MSWCWFDHLPAEQPDLEGALASASVADLHGRPDGLLAVWPRGRKPTSGATRMDARLHPARILQLGPGLLGRVPPPPGPAIQRYRGKPWPASGFDDD